MSILKQTNGNDLTYWPISGLVEGEESETLEFYIDGDDLPLSPNGQLTCTDDPRVTTWCRINGTGSFFDLVANPVDLSTVLTTQNYEIFIEALTPISGLERVPIGVSVGAGTSAGWSI